MQSIAPHFPHCFYFSHFLWPNLRRLISLVIQAFSSNRRHSYEPWPRQQCRQPTKSDENQLAFWQKSNKILKINSNILLWPTNSVVVRIAMHFHGFRSMNVHCPDSSMPLLLQPCRRAPVQSSNGACDILWPPESPVTVCTCYPNCSTLALPQLVRPVRWPTKEFVCNWN